MTKLRGKSESIRSFILGRVDKHPIDIAKLTADHFGLTRQAVNKHLQKLTEEKSLAVSGQTRNKTYKLASILAWAQSYEITPELAEDLVWREDIRLALGNMPENVIEIWHYGVTEMLNNVIDHSGGTTLTVEIKKTATTTEMLIF